MKKLLLVLTVFVAMAAVSPLFGQSEEYTQSRLGRQVRHEILMQPYYGVFDAIGYTIDGSSVTLTGYVTRPIIKSDVAAAVRDIDGVTNVMNNIEVLPVSPSDDRLRARLLRALSTQGGALYRYFLGANPSIRIVVRRGHVILEGFVDSKGDYDRAYIVARGVSGSFSVTNNLRVVGGPR